MEMEGAKVKRRVKIIFMIGACLFGILYLAEELQELDAKRDCMGMYWEASDIDGWRAKQIISQNQESADPYQMAVWAEIPEIKIENPDLKRTCEAKGIEAAGNMELLTGKNIFLGNAEEPYCWLSYGAAQKLFGDGNISGKFVKCQGCRYQILGVMLDEADNFILISPSGTEGIHFQRILVRRKNQIYSIDAIKEELAGQFGIYGNLMDYNLAAEIFLCAFLGAISFGLYKIWRQKEGKNPRQLGVCLICLWFLGLKFAVRYGIDLVPTAWGDFKAVGNLYGERGKSLVYFLSAPKGMLEQRFCFLLIKSSLCCFFVLLLILWLEKQFRLKKTEPSSGS